MYLFTFPKDDERAMIADLIMDLPTRELVALRKQLTAQRKALARSAKTKPPRVEG